MNSNLLIPLMLLATMVGALLVLAVPRRDNDRTAGTMAFFVSLLPLALGVLMAAHFNYQDGGQWQEVFTAAWIPQLGIRFSVGVDSISLWLTLLTVVVTPLCILDGIGKIRHRHNEFYFWMLLMYFGLIGMFCATDVMLFYLFFEFTLIPMFFLIGIWGGTERRRAAGKFFLYAFTGSVFVLASLIYLAWVHDAKFGTVSFSLNALYQAGQSLSLTQQCLVFAGLLIGFAIKVPLFPVHTWLPLALTESPTPAAVMMATFKLGAYGLIRFALPMLPLAVQRLTPLLAVLCIISILYAALVSWVQKDMKKLIAYSLVSHLGLCVLAMLALTTTGLTGSVMIMINQGLTVAALLLIIGMIQERYGTRNLKDVSGLFLRLPALGFFVGFFVIATVAVPGLNGFISELLSLLGTYVSGGSHGGELGPAYAIPAALGMIVGALYMLYWLGKVFFGPLEEPVRESAAASAPVAAPPQDLNFREWLVLAPLAVLVLILGIYPNPLLRSLEPAVNEIRAPDVAVEMSGPSGHRSEMALAAHHELLVRNRAKINSCFTAQKFWPPARRERGAYPGSGSGTSEQRSWRSKGPAGKCEVIFARLLKRSPQVVAASMR